MSSPWTLHQIETFFLVARHGGYRAAVAAMEHPITEPALHQQVRNLERALGHRLLERGGGRRMVPTPEGRSLYDSVAPFLETLPRVMSTLRADSGGRLVVASEALYVDELAAPAARAVLASHGEAEVVLRDAVDERALRDLQAGRVDVFLGSLPDADSGGSFDVLGRLGLRLLVPADHAFASRRRAPRLDQLGDIPYVLYEKDSRPRRYADAAAHAAGFTLRAAAEAGNAAALHALVRAGVAPAFVPALPRRGPLRTVAEDGVVTFDLTRVVRELVELPVFGVARRSDAAPSGLMGAFVEAARETAAVM